jgi:phytoene desaturase
MNPARKPDRVLIVGGGLGGLSAAIRLRLAGREVALYESNERVGGRANLIEKAGYRFDTGPSLLNYPWVFEELFRAAGRSLGDYVRLLPVDPSIRFRWPDGGRFTLTSNLQRLREECERIEPGSSSGLMAFLADAERKYSISFQKLVCRNSDHLFAWLGILTPGELLRSAVWRSLDGELGRFFRSPRIREALGSYAMYLGGSPWTLPGLFSILPYGELAYGLWLPEGGIYGLVSAIERLALELGVRIHTRSPVRHIRVEGGRATGIELENGATVDADRVVSNVDVPTTREVLLGQTGGGRRIRMTPGVITFYWGLRGRIEGLGHHTIFLPDDYRDTFEDLLRRKRIPEHLPFYVSVPSDTDPSLAPPGDSTVFVLAPTPRLSELGPIDWPAAVASVRRRILMRLRQEGVVLPEDRFVFETAWTPDTWSRAFGLYDGSAFGATHSLFQMGPFRPRNADRRIRGLYYTGASTTPGTGLPMVVLGGEMTARRLLNDAP